MTIETTEARAFHRSRRMFAIIDGEPQLAELHSPENHREWFRRAGWIIDDDDPAFDAIVRGYTDGRDLYAYRGKDYLGDEVVEAVMRRHADGLAVLLSLPPTAQLMLGAIPQPIASNWPPRRMLGCIAELKPA